VGVAAGLGAHDADAHLGEQLPVGVEVAGGGVEELEAGQVRSATAVADHRRVEGAPEGIGGQQVLVWVADEGHPLGDGLECPAQAQPRRVLGGSTPPRAARGGDAVGRARQVEEVGAFGLVELQCPGQRLEDPGGCAGDLAALEAGVVLHAETGLRRDLAATQPGHTPAAGGRETDLVRRDASTTGGEELTHFPAQVLAVVHDVEPRGPPRLPELAKVPCQYIHQQ
jgi:hypothetical protein